MAAFVNALADSGSENLQPGIIFRHLDLILVIITIFGFLQMSVTDTDTHTKRKLKIQRAVETNWKNLHFTVHLVSA